jgi:hypothetical protein
VLLLSDDPTSSTGPVPEALIEEARRRQRQRSRRRTAVLAIAAVLVLLGFGINQLARGGGSVHATPFPPATVAAQTPTVTYEKIVVQKIVPNLPVEQRTIETWSTSTPPLTERQIVTLAGGRRFEIGSGPGQDKVLGALEVNFLYDASTKTIYRTGYYPVEASETNRSRGKSAFKHVLAEPGVRLTGTRLYRGRPVYVLEAKRPGFRETTFVDKRTYEPMFSEVVGTDIRTVVRTLAFKSLPATQENLARASLATAHPGVRTVLQASPRIKELYGQAAFLSGDHS